MKPQDRTRTILRSTLDAGSRLVAIAIADHMDAHDEAFPSVATLGEETALSESTVQRVVKAGLAAGWLTASGINGGRRTFRIIWERLNDAPPRNPRQADTGVTLTPVSQGRGTGVTVTGVPVSPGHPRGVTVTPEAVTIEATSEAPIRAGAHASERCTPAHPCTPTCARLRRCVAHLPARTEPSCPTTPSSPSSAPLTAPPAPPPAAPSSAPVSSARSGDTSPPSRTTSAAQPSTRSPERAPTTTTTDGYGAAPVRVGDVDLPPDLVALTGGNLRLVGKLTQAGINSTRGLLLIPLVQWSDPDSGKCFVPGCGALVGTLRALLMDRWGVDLGALASRPVGRVGAVGFVPATMEHDDPEALLARIIERDRRAAGGAA